jgi:biopolymer transport protein ExbD
MSLLRTSKKKLRKRHLNRSEIVIMDMTPMIDIVFILIVFFVLTSNVTQNIFDLELPKADQNYKEEKTSGNGEYAVGETKIFGYEAFKVAILNIYKADSSVKFLIIAESSLSVGRMMELLTFLKSNNITKIDILLEKS